MRLEWGVLALIAAVLLASGAVWVRSAWPGQSLPPMLWAVLTAGMLAYQLAHLWRHLEMNAPHHAPHTLYSNLGAANWITMLRAMGLALLTGFILSPRPVGWLAWAPGGLYLAAALLDFADGAAARLTRRTSRLGELLDMHWDSYGVLVACILLVQYGAVPLPYLLVGLARYLFLAGMNLRERRGLTNYPMPPSMVRRALAGTQMGFIGAALLPVFPTPVTRAAAVIFMLPLLAGFLRDWLYVSGALQPRTEKIQWTAALKDWGPVGLRVVGLVLLAVGFTRPLQPGLAAVYALALVSFTLGAAGRIVSLAALLAAGLALKGSPADGISWALLFTCAVLMLSGTGKISLWKPEDWLIYHHVG